MFGLLVVTTKLWSFVGVEGRSRLFAWREGHTLALGSIIKVVRKLTRVDSLLHCPTPCPLELSLIHI